MKIRTTSELTSKLTQELVWRKKELSDLKFFMEDKSTNEMVKRMLSRCGIALLYAHWEGFIKLTSKFFLEFVATERPLNKDLKLNFLTLSLLGNNIFPKNNKKSEYGKVTDFFINKMDQSSSIQTTIDTESNLTSKVLKEIMWCLGLSYKAYETKEKFLDTKLLGKRNQIAHGEEIYIDLKDFEEMRKIIVELMTDYKNQLENLALTKGYKH